MGIIQRTILTGVVTFILMWSLKPLFKSKSSVPQFSEETESNSLAKKPRQERRPASSKINQTASPSEMNRRSYLSTSNNDSFPEPAIDIPEEVEVGVIEGTAEQVYEPIKVRSGYPAPAKASFNRQIERDSGTVYSKSSLTGPVISDVDPFDSLLPDVTPLPEQQAPNSPPSLDCSASIGNGLYNRPVSISLNCTSNAEIKYCISEGTCCDPEMGSTYTSPIILGENQKTFCVSYEGTTPLNVKSEIASVNYSFEFESPHLLASHPKLYYQTTQLNMQMSLSSNNFGSPFHFAGVINLTGRDPSPSGDNLSCTDIVSNYSSYSSPSAHEAITLTDVSQFAPTTEINAHLALPEIIYGSNFLTSYIFNDETQMVSCSTTKVVLEDFPYFEANISQAQIGSNTVREFEGAFSPYGFFEPNFEVFRGPAGSKIEEKDEIELRQGLFAIFY